MDEFRGGAFKTKTTYTLLQMQPINASHERQIGLAGGPWLGNTPRRG